MLEGLQYDRPSKVFSDVRFVILGFDPINKPMVLSKLVDGGGVDVGQYGPICTHVIVDKLLYDDPICVAARSDGKTLVNGLWVAHSFDVGMPVDPNSIMYRPLKDLKGILGAKSLVVCLTGYQRQDREDIMTMVSLMGANFSKPLVASKVTHLICYKFEGEKYELAKKMKKIKLVNHLWLEDCLKAWEILPEADYDKSGYELEVLEAEAKDSEEETDIASKHYELLNPNQELRRNQLDSSASKGWSNVIDTNDMVSTTGYERISDQDPCHPKVLDSRDARAFGNVSCGEPVKTYERTTVPVTVGNDLASTSRNEKSPHSDARKLSPKSYSRKTMYLGGMAGNLGATPTVSTGNYNVSYGVGISSMTGKLKDGTDINCFRTPKGTVLRPEEQSTILDEKRKMNVSCGNSKSQKTGHNSEAHISAGSVEMTRSELVKPASLISGPVETNNRLFSNNDAHYSSLATALNTPQRFSATISSSVGRKSPTSGTPFSKTVNSEIRHDGKLEEALQINSAGSNKDSLGSKSVGKDVATGEAPKLSSPRSKRLEIEKSNDTPNQSLHADAYLKPPTRKMFGRKSWSKSNTTNLKGSIYLDKSVSEDDPAINSIAGHEKLVMVPPTVNLIVLVAPTNGVSQSRNKIQQHSMSTDDETEAPEDNEQNVVREAVSEEKYGEDEPDIIGEDDKSEDLQTNETDGSALGVHSHNTTVGKDKDGTKQQKDTCGKAKLGESTHMQKVAKENISGQKKRPLSKINKTTVPSRVPKTKEVPEVVSEENYSIVEAEIIGVEKALGVHSHKASAEEKDGSKQTKSTCGKRKLWESPHIEKVVKENISMGGKHPPSKINKTTIPSEVLEGKEENEVPGALCEEKYGEVEPDIVGNVGTEDKSEEVQTYKTDCNALGVHTHKTSVADKDGTKQKKTTCGKRKLGQSTRMEDVVKEKKNAGGKHPLSKIRKGTGLSVTKIAVIEEAESQKNEGSTPHLAGKTKRTRSLNYLTQSVEVEKENMAICAVDQNVNHGKKQVGKLASKASRKIDTGASKSNLDKVQVQTTPKLEPVWFILSGHKLQRKEFQQVIRRLKGKVCNVSHQWSYQATHFIVPDPVRRIEKFFAAAASGRWILNTNYLSDSNREGKFLAEEPYEWYKSGLSEDGAINLEAPRKWRLQRERTGHGAFYKMSIIIYGECISPSLDTLKRVVKAGDGTILATSPPYTRFLDSGVDFAVVSPGMPRVDMWVQEFLRHEIPCVVADYLVEFVCKPGYSLERHVQYNTHVWAEKAFNNLVKQSKEVVGLMTPPNDDGGSGLPCHELVTPPDDCSDSDDLACQVCGSYDRGEEMLICGDERGCIGCGIGMHIDCCDPPLADVPEEDWFCPKCSESRHSKKAPKSTKKGTPVPKRK